MNGSECRVAGRAACPDRRAHLGAVRGGGQEPRVLRTPFVLLDRVGTALDAEQVALVLNVLSEMAITYIVFKADRADASYYDAILEIAGDGTWQWKSLRGRRASEPEPSGGALKA